MELLARAIHVARNVDELLVKCQIAGLEGLDMSKLIYVDVLIAYFIDCGRGHARVRFVQPCRV